ncbi:MAG TPA: hypothetical protein PKA64_26290 [Myxococcota bacterium]|nr:hypothetical protein [Myxococcota bacterium]
MSTAAATPTPAEFVTACGRRGIRLRVVGGKIKATGNPPPNPEKFGAYLRSRKTELVELLAPRRAGRPETPQIADEPQKAPSVPQDAPPPSLAPDVPPPPALAADLGIDPVEDAQETVAFLRPFFASLDWSKVKLEALRLPSGRWVRAWPEPIRDFRDAPTRARRETDDEDFDDLGGDLDDGTESALKIVDDSLGPKGWCNKTEEWGMPASFVQGYLADAADLAALWAAINAEGRR